VQQSLQISFFGLSWSNLTNKREVPAFIALDTIKIQSNMVQALHESKGLPTNGCYLQLCQFLVFSYIGWNWIRNVIVPQHSAMHVSRVLYHIQEEQQRREENIYKLIFSNFWILASMMLPYKILRDFISFMNASEELPLDKSLILLQ
jgi:hypothetical protein